MLGLQGAPAHGRDAGREDRARRAADPDIDVVIPIPDIQPSGARRRSRTQLGVTYREGFIKNRYVGRTFIMPGQAARKKSVRQKLNAIGIEFKGKNVLLVDDSIVRGTTSREIMQMARDAGAQARSTSRSAAPPVRYPERLRHRHADQGRTGGARPHRRRRSASMIGCDALIYQDVDAMKRAIGSLNPASSTASMPRASTASTSPATSTPKPSRA